MSDETAVCDVLRRLIAAHGAPRVVVHNVAELIIAPLPEAGLAAFQRTWTSMAQSAFLLARAVLPAMAEAGTGSFLVSSATASHRSGANFTAFASAKFALRGLTQSLARAYQPQRVYMAHVILDGIIDTARSRTLHSLDPARMMHPNEIAEAYLALAHQARSTWTHELDLRPAKETF